MSKTPRRIREPVQAYLDEPDTALLEELSARTDLSKAELIRRGIRRLAQDLALAGKPFAGLSALSGVLDSAARIPADLAARHDDYLHGAEQTATPKRRR
jgi:hypothetical protein